MDFCFHLFIINRQVKGKNSLNNNLHQPTEKLHFKIAISQLPKLLKNLKK